MIIRNATNNDIKYILKIIDENYKKYGDKINLKKYDNDLNNINESYFNKNGKFWVIELNKNIIGCNAVIPIDSNTLEMKRIYIKKNFRRKKFGQKILNKAQNFAFNNNYKKIILWSDSRYKNAHNFFCKNGFIYKKNRIMNDADNKYRALLFEKKLK